MIERVAPSIKAAAWIFATLLLSILAAPAIATEPEREPFSRFDSIPPDYRSLGDAPARRARVSRGPASTWSTSTGAAWNQNVVTVAFYEGDEKTWSLIESAALEWTKHSRYFSFSFRTNDGQFRRWSPRDSSAAAEIRIGFYTVEPLWGEWSLLGVGAREQLPGRPTMNLEGVPGAASGLGPTSAAWLNSYAHSVVLHEFGHALGLAHEHFHTTCQSDLKFEPDPGYRPRQDSSRPYGPDPAGNSPGALLAYQGPPHNMDRDVARRNLMLSAALQQVGVLQQSPSPDQRSVMLYDIASFLFRSGQSSPCLNLGDQSAGGRRYASTLSSGDIAYFTSAYDRPLPTVM